jgi:hypothetical protein
MSPAGSVIHVASGSLAVDVAGWLAIPYNNPAGSLFRNVLQNVICPFIIMECLPIFNTFLYIFESSS